MSRYKNGDSVFVKVEGYSMTDVGFPSKLEAMGFPHAATLSGIKYEKHNRDFWDESIGVRVAGRIASVRHVRPTPAPPAGFPADVARAFEALRLDRNAAFPGERPWPPLSQ